MTSVAYRKRTTVSKVLRPYAWESALFLACFFLYATFSLMHQKVYTSPDETANAVFAKRFSTSFSLVIPQPVQTGARIYLHPRSTVVTGEGIVPTSFFGLPVFAGLLAHVVGSWAIPLLTPALAAFGVVCFGRLLMLWRDRRSAVLGAVLLALHPGYWYYATRGMFHNVGFVALLLIGTYVFTRGVQRHRSLDIILGGAAFGAALAFRTSEVFWMTGAAIVPIWIFRKEFFSSRWWLGIVGAFCVFAPFLLIYTAHFGSPTHLGYAQDTLAVGNDAQRTISISLLRLLFPFGFDLGHALPLAWQYLFTLFSWQTIFIILGMFVLVFRRTKAEHRRSLHAWGGVSCIVAVWLVVLYGSWNLTEITQARGATLGSSYVRYWLPIYVLCIPYLVEGIQWASQHIFRFRASLAYIVATFLLLAGLIVVFDPLYGLQATARAVRNEVAVHDAVSALLPKGSVIISGLQDKALFPDFTVAYDVPLSSGLALQRLRTLLDQQAVYVLLEAGTANERSYQSLLTLHQGFLERVGQISSSLTLYQLHLARLSPAVVL